MNSQVFKVHMRIYHSLIRRMGRIDFNTINPSLPSAHRDGFPVPSLMRRMSVLNQNSGGIGKSILDVQDISRDLRDYLRAKPEGNL